MHTHVLYHWRDNRPTARRQERSGVQGLRDTRNMVILDHHPVVNTYLRRRQPAVLVLWVQAQRLETIHTYLTRGALGIADTRIICTNRASREMEQPLLAILATGHHTAATGIALEAAPTLRAGGLVLLRWVLAQRIIQEPQVRLHVNKRALMRYTDTDVAYITNIGRTAGVATIVISRIHNMTEWRG